MSASTMRVRVAFSIVNLVFPLCEPQVIVWNQHQHLHHAAFISKYHQLDTVCQAQQLKEVRYICRAQLCVLPTPHLSCQATNAASQVLSSQCLQRCIEAAKDQG